VNGEKDMFELMLDRRSAAEAGKEKEFEWGMFSVEVRTYLTQYIFILVLESQPPTKPST